MKIQKHKLNQGFTIIEVMIVLAIAALILLIVFLAVPGLQRSQRNSARHQDVNRLSTAIIAFIANSGGLPGSVNPGATDVATILKDFGTPGGYPTTLAASVPIGTLGSGAVSLNSKAQPAIPATDIDTLDIVTSATCNTATGATNLGTANQVALQYTLETSNSTVSQPECQNVQ
jgi:prepilin-type N-terminal cleavage/methylation domain-containing protein